MSDYLQILFYHYALSDYNVCTQVQPSFFEYGSGKLSLAYEMAREYVFKYKAAPSQQTMSEMAKIKNIDDKVSDTFLEMIYRSLDDLENYDEKWLFEKTTAWAKMMNFREHVINTAQYIKKIEKEMDIEDVDKDLERARSIMNSGLIIDFSNAKNEAKNFWNCADHLQTHMLRRSTGYPFIDMCLDGGYWNGSLIVFVGAPKIGKSQFLGNLAAKSVMQGHNTLYISLELPEEMIMARIGANILGVSALSYKAFSENQDELSKRLQQVYNRNLVTPGELRIKSFPTSTLTAISLESEVLALEEKLSAETGKPFKFDNIFLDYINIMLNWRNPNSDNTYMKIKQIAEDTKAAAISHDWAIITATQTNREQFDGEDMSVKDVAESAALNATVDVMFGIIATPIMKSLGQYYIKCMLDRVSPQDNKRKQFLIDKNYLRITEDPNSPITDVHDAVVTGLEKYNREKALKDESKRQTKIMPKSAVDTLPTHTTTTYASSAEQNEDIHYGSSLADNTQTSISYNDSASASVDSYDDSYSQSSQRIFDLTTNGHMFDNKNGCPF